MVELTPQALVVEIATEPLVPLDFAPDVSAFVFHIDVNAAQPSVVASDRTIFALMIPSVAVLAPGAHQPPEWRANML